MNTIKKKKLLSRVPDEEVYHAYFALVLPSYVLKTGHAGQGTR